jgi:transcriptional regulator with XRE-family HTH domain
MDQDNMRQLGLVVQQQRQTKGWSTRRLAAAVGVHMAQIVRLEQGTVQSPHAETLAAIAEQLELPLADLFGLAGFAAPTELPSFKPYLRTKYRDLPPEAVAELERNFQAIADKYGTEGPRDGEDEH